MRFLLDTDHISILQKGSGAEYEAVAARVAAVGPDQIAFPVVSLHEQTVGCNAYINRARSPAEVVRGYAMLGKVLAAFASAPVLPFDPAAAAVFDDLAGRRLRVATLDLRIAATARPVPPTHPCDPKRPRLRPGFGPGDGRLGPMNSL